MNDGRVDNGSAAKRIGRLLPWVMAVGSTALFVHWAVKWVRGDPDQYSNEIMGGLVLTLYLMLSTVSEVVKNSEVARAMKVASAVTVIPMFVVILSDVALTPGMVIALAIFVAGLVKSVHSLWPTPGTSWASWKTAPTTLDQRRGMCTGMAIVLLGGAVFVGSMTRLGSSQWPLNLIGLVATLLFAIPAILFVGLRRRLK